MESAAGAGEEKSVGWALSPEELAWMRRQQRKAIRLMGSKYLPHQGTREKARRLKRMERAQ